MKSRLLKIATLTLTLCVGMMFKTQIVYASGSHTPGAVWENDVSGFKEYCPNASEFTVDYDVNSEEATVSAFTCACASEYDVVILPGVFIKDTVSYDAVYEPAVIEAISELGKGVAIQDGGTVKSLPNDMAIPYIRFDVGSTLTDYNQAFKGWTLLTKVEGISGAFAETTSGYIDFNETFSGCVGLTEITLDLNDKGSKFTNTFNGCDNLTQITISNTDIDSISNLAVRSNNAYSVTSGYIDRAMTVKFNNCTFPLNTGRDYLSKAFTSISGKIIFTNCEAGDGSEYLNFNSAFEDSYSIKVSNTMLDQYNAFAYTTGATANIEVSGIKAYQTKNMFKNSTYGVIKLTNLIDDTMLNASSMFYGAKFVNIEGIDTWKFGAINLTSLFENAKTFYVKGGHAGQTDYLNGKLHEDIASIDFSSVTDFNYGMCFTNDGYYADYSGITLRDVRLFEPVKDAVPFYSCETNPVQYKIHASVIYYQTEQDKTECGGYKLTAINASGSNIIGTKVPKNTFFTPDCASITVINKHSGATDIYRVIPGQQLQKYISDDATYYTDSDCSTEAVLTRTIGASDEIILYTKYDYVTRDIDADIEATFSSADMSTVTCKVDGVSGDLLLTEYDPVLHIHKETVNSDDIVEFSLPVKSDVVFYDVSVTITKDGEQKDVKSLSESVNIVVQLPDDYVSGTVQLMHFDKEFAKKPTKISATVDKQNNTIKFGLNSFSHVGVFYNDPSYSSQDIKVKWIDKGDTDYRDDIMFYWRANYDSGAVVDGEVEYIVSEHLGEDEDNPISFEYPDEVMGSPLYYISVNYEVESSIAYEDSWDDTQFILTMTSDDKSVQEVRTITVDYSDVEEVTYRTFATTSRECVVNIDATYEDNEIKQLITRKTLNVNDRVYTLEYTVDTVSYDGIPLASVKYDVRVPGGYVAEIDYETNTIAIKVKSDEYGEMQRRKIMLIFNDSRDSKGIRPMLAEFTYRAEYGSTKSIEESGSVPFKEAADAYNYNYELPESINGISMSKFEVTPQPVDGYVITVDTEGTNTQIVYEYESEQSTGNKRTVTVKFTGDSADIRPSAVNFVLYSDSSNKTVTGKIDTSGTSATGVYMTQVDVPDNTTYYVYGMSLVGSAAPSYSLTASGLTITASYNSFGSGGGTTTVDDAEFKITINIDDSSNVDGSRPDKVKVTVTDGTNTKTEEVTVSGTNSAYDYIFDVPSGGTWKISKVEGFPDRYKSSIAEKTATFTYTPEKVTKTVSATFSGDGDNKDNTRPASIKVTLKSGDAVSVSSTISSQTNWTANVEVYKYVKGVEAAYTLEADDVSNYSKSISGEKITYTFTGTLSAEAQKAEDSKTSSTATATSDSTAVEKEEPDFSIENFDWIDYANRYPDLKRAYGYNKQKLYAHYIRYGIAEGRYATFTGKYSTVNEDVLAAYFPDDYDYAFVETSSTESSTETNTEVESTDDVEVVESEDSDETVSGNSTTDEDTEVADEDSDDVVVTVDPVTGEVTITDVQQYKTGDERDFATMLCILFGILFLSAGSYVGYTTFKSRRVL